MNKIFNTARSTLTIAMLAGLVWVLASAKTARADVMGQVWEGVPDAGNAADPANRSASLPNALFTSTRAGLYNILEIVDAIKSGRATLADLKPYSETTITAAGQGIDRGRARGRRPAGTYQKSCLAIAVHNMRRAPQNASGGHTDDTRVP